MLEVVAALLSVLALRNGILGGPAVSFETLFAVGLWGTLLAIACGFTIRGRDQARRAEPCERDSPIRLTARLRASLFPGD